MSGSSVSFRYVIKYFTSLMVVSTFFNTTWWFLIHLNSRGNMLWSCKIKQQQSKDSSNTFIFTEAPSLCIVLRIHLVFSISLWPLYAFNHYFRFCLPIMKCEYFLFGSMDNSKTVKNWYTDRVCFNIKSDFYHSVYATQVTIVTVNILCHSFFFKRE